MPARTEGVNARPPKPTKPGPKKPPKSRPERVPVWKAGDLVATRKNVRVKLAGRVDGRDSLVLLSGTAWTVDAVEPVYPERSTRPRTFAYRLKVPGYSWRIVRREGRLRPLKAGEG